MNTNMDNYSKIQNTHFFTSYIFTYSFDEKYIFLYFPSLRLLKNSFEMFSQSIQERNVLDLHICVNTETVIYRDPAQRLKKYTTRVQ